MADNGNTPPPIDVPSFMGGLIMELCIALMYVSYASFSLFSCQDYLFCQIIWSDNRTSLCVYVELQERPVVA